MKRFKLPLFTQGNQGVVRRVLFRLLAMTPLLLLPVLLTSETSASSLLSPSLTIFLPHDFAPTGADRAVLYGTIREWSMETRVNLSNTSEQSITITEASSDNSEWTWLDLSLPFTIEPGQGWWRKLRFSPQYQSGVGKATFTIYSDAPDSPHQFTVYGARVATIIPTVTAVLSPNSIDLPVRLRLDPVRNVLYAKGFEGSSDDDPQGEWLVRMDLASHQETAAIQFPDMVRDHGVTKDGKWLYVVTDGVLYTVNAETFQIIDAFIPPEVDPPNADLLRIGVFSSTLAFVGTNPHLASGGPVYQWNPQTDEWSPTSLCDSASDEGSRAYLQVSRDYTTLGGLCDPCAGPTTAFAYRLGETVETWKVHERWRAAISPDGQQVLSRIYGTNLTGSLVVNQRGNSDDLHIHLVDPPQSFALTFGSGPLAYIAAEDSGYYDHFKSVYEVNTYRGIQTRRIVVPSHTSSGYPTYIPSIEGIVVKGNTLYAALWGSDMAGWHLGEIVAISIPDFDSSPPTSKVLALPEFSTKEFDVEWSGSDIGPAEIRSYDVQYRGGPYDIWTDWLTDTLQTSATFAGEYGHTYYFRCRARDWVGNVELYPDGDGDTSTHVYQHSLSSQVSGNRGQPVAFAFVSAQPSALNTDLSDANGNASLYFDQPGTHDVHVTRDGFGSLPPMRSLLVTDSVKSVHFYLPPTDDCIADGGFEAGDLAAWTISGEITPVLTVTAHTGDFAVTLGGPISPTLPGTGPWSGVIEQEIAVSPTSASTTLSLLYQVKAVEPASDTLQISLIGTTRTVTHTLSLTVSGWVHQWYDLSDWEDSMLTLRIEWHQIERTKTTGVIMDEVSLGSSMRGVYPIYLPLALRNKP
jgi:hypothetical protein